MVIILDIEYDLTPFIELFIDHLVEIINDIPNSYVQESQMVGSSQPPVNFKPYLPKNATRSQSLFFGPYSDPQACPQKQ